MALHPDRANRASFPNPSAHLFTQLANTTLTPITHHTMKSTLLAITLLAVGIAPAFAQTTIAKWTFETSAPTTAGSFAPEIGSGLASAFHASASTYSSPAGNGSAHSFSSNTWAVGDYYQFQVSTTGYSNINITWDQISSNTGPKDFSLLYSTDGLTYLNAISSYTVLANATPNTWSSATPVSTTSYSFDFSGISAINNQAAVYFRLRDFDTISANGGTVAAGGTDRVDNVAVTVIPEPTTYALLAGVATFAIVLWRRKVNAITA